MQSSRLIEQSKSLWKHLVSGKFLPHRRKPHRKKTHRKKPHRKKTVKVLGMSSFCFECLNPVPMHTHSLQAFISQNCQRGENGLFWRKETNEHVESCNLTNEKLQYACPVCKLQISISKCRYSVPSCTFGLRYCDYLLAQSELTFLKKVIAVFVANRS